MASRECRAGNAQDLREKIDQHYRVRLILDNLPITTYDLAENPESIRPGYEVGYERDGKYYLNNHLMFKILVHKTNGQYTRARENMAEIEAAAVIEVRHALLSLRACSPVQLQPVAREGVAHSLPASRAAAVYSGATGARSCYLETSSWRARTQGGAGWEYSCMGRLSRAGAWRRQGKMSIDGSLGSCGGKRTEGAFRGTLSGGYANALRGQHRGCKQAPGAWHAKPCSGQAVARGSLLKLACSYFGKACALQGGARRRLAASRPLGREQQEGPETSHLPEAALLEQPVLIQQGVLTSECACALQGGARRRLAAARRLAEDKAEDPETKQLREAAERRAGGSDISMYMVVGFEARLPRRLFAGQPLSLGCAPVGFDISMYMVVGFEARLPRRSQAGQRVNH